MATISQFVDKLMRDLRKVKPKNKRAWITQNSRKLMKASWEHYVNGGSYLGDYDPTSEYGGALPITQSKRMRLACLLKCLAAAIPMLPANKSVSLRRMVPYDFGRNNAIAWYHWAGLEATNIQLNLDLEGKLDSNSGVIDHGTYKLPDID